MTSDHTFFTVKRAPHTIPPILDPPAQPYTRASRQENCWILNTSLKYSRKIVFDFWSSRNEKYAKYARKANPAK